MSINIVESIATANKCYQASIPPHQRYRKPGLQRPCRTGGAVCGS